MATAAHTLLPLSQLSRPVQLDYRLRSHVQRADVTPVSARTPWWNHVETWAYDYGMKPVLEIWLDDRSAPVIIRMVGVLDQRTTGSLPRDLSQSSLTAFAELSEAGSIASTRAEMDSAIFLAK